MDWWVKMLSPSGEAKSGPAGFSSTESDLFHEFLRELSVCVIRQKFKVLQILNNSMKFKSFPTYIHRCYIQLWYGK